MNNPIVRNILAVLAGVVVGSAVNMGIVMSGGSIIPLPEGVNPADMESLKENMHLFEAKHFLMPFLAHALGTFFGALVAGLIAATHKMKFALGIGAWFLLGGVANLFMLPSPTWFAVVDISLAYFPMAYLAGKLTAGKS